MASNLRIQTTAKSTLAWTREEDGSGNPDFLNTANDTNQKPFGKNESISSIDLGEETEELQDWATRDLDDELIVGYQPTFTVEAEAANFWILELIIDQFGNGSGTNPTTWSTQGNEDPYTFTTTVGNTRSGEDYVIDGCRVATATIETSGGAGESGNPVSISLEIQGALVKRTEPGSQISDGSLSTSFRALTFANVKANFGRTNSFVLTDLTMTINNNPQGIKQIRNNVDNDGGVTDVTFHWGNRRIEFQHTELRSENADEAFKRILEDANEESLRATVPAADKPNYSITISNNIGAGTNNTGGDLNEVVFDLTSMFPENFEWSEFTEPSSAVQEQLTQKPTDAGAISATYKNGVSTKP